MILALETSRNSEPKGAAMNDSMVIGKLVEVRSSVETGILIVATSITRPRTEGSILWRTEI